jgi:nucleolar protein 16
LTVCPCITAGPEILRKEWDIHKTARQNLDKLGLARRPLSLKQSGGIEKLVSDEQPQQDNEDAASSEEDAYASDNDNDNDNDIEDSDNATDDDNDNEHAQPQAGPSNTQPPMDKTSKSIPKGFARIIRDAQGNVVDVVMSAFDEPDEPPKLNTIEAEEALIKSEQQAAEADDVDTPWGKPLISREHETRLKKAAVPVLAKSAALRGVSSLSLSYILLFSILHKAY